MVFRAGDDHQALYWRRNQNQSYKELGRACNHLLGCNVRIQLGGAGTSRDRVRSADILHLCHHNVCRDAVSGGKRIEQQLGIYGGYHEI